MMDSKESLPGPAILFSTSCPPGLQAVVSNLTEDSFTLAFDQVGKVELVVMMMLKKSLTLMLDQEGKVEIAVMMILKDSFTLLLDQEGKAELSCEDAEGRTYNRTEWAAEFLFSQLQVALLLIICQNIRIHFFDTQPMTEYNCSGWISRKRGHKFPVDQISVTTMADRSNSICELIMVS